jgi:hypothetical protein
VDQEPARQVDEMTCSWIDGFGATPARHDRIGRTAGICSQMTLRRNGDPLGSRCHANDQADRRRNAHLAFLTFGKMKYLAFRTTQNIATVQSNSDCIPRTPAKSAPFRTHRWMGSQP